jgi:thiol-disulfide isomerase/thioredoxin
MTGITVLILVLIVATVVGLVLRARNGKVRSIETVDAAPETRALLIEAGAQPGTATVLHFSADWCGPCAAVRRVVGQVLKSVDGPTELELDIDANPDLAKDLGVLSLPTTFVFDRDLIQRARIAGVPSAESLRSTLVDL